MESLEACVTALGASQERHNLTVQNELRRLFDAIERLKKELASDND